MSVQLCECFRTPRWNSWSWWRLFLYYTKFWKFDIIIKSNHRLQCFWVHFSSSFLMILQNWRLRPCTFYLLLFFVLIPYSYCFNWRCFRISHFRFGFHLILFHFFRYEIHTLISRLTFFNLKIQFHFLQVFIHIPMFEFFEKETSIIYRWKLRKISAIVS